MSNPRPLQGTRLTGTAWVFDLDGTLINMADRPDDVVVPQTLLTDLDQLRQRAGNRLAIVSGRALLDLERLLPIPALTLVGNHGIEYRIAGHYGRMPLSASATTSLETIRPHLEALSRRVPGLLLEDKRWTLSVHVRAVADALQSQVKTELLKSLQPHPSLELRPAEACWEIRPIQGADKGRALQWLNQRWDYPSPLWVFGDDLTDEDAFRAAGSEAYTVIVGGRRPTNARYFVTSPDQVRKLLSEFRV